MRVRFTISTGYVNCNHIIEEEIDDNMTDEELDDYAEQLAWEYINVAYERLPE